MTPTKNEVYIILSIYPRGSGTFSRRRESRFTLFFLSFLNAIETFNINSNSLLALIQLLEAKCEALTSLGMQKVEYSIQIVRNSIADITDVNFFISVSSYFSTSVMRNAVSISVKFLVCIALLIFARGGIPRFRFDYLTKLGWIRFLSLVLLVFTIEIFIINVF